MKGKILRNSSSMTFLGEAIHGDRKENGSWGREGRELFSNLYSFICHENLLNANSVELYS